jgi:hypothetical protein
VERKFLLLKQGLRAFSGGGFEIVEVMEPTGKYSYYRNPKPTHLRKALTNFVKGVITTVTDVGAGMLAREVAASAVKSELRNSRSIGSIADAPATAMRAAGAAANSAAVSLQVTQGLVQFDEEGGIFHEEWIIVNNANQEKTAVYSGNIEQLAGRMLQACAKYPTLSQSELTRLLRVDNIAELVKWLNHCD